MRIDLSKGLRIYPASGSSLNMGNDYLQKIHRRASMINLGYVTKGQSDDGINGAIAYCKITDTPAATVSTISAYVKNVHGGTTEYVKFAIYSHDAVNDLPESKLAETDAISLAASFDGLKTGAISDVVLEAGGTYWLAIIGQADVYIFDNDGGEKFEVFAATYPTFPDPCPNTGSLYDSTGYMSIYATCAT